MSLIGVHLWKITMIAHDWKDTHLCIEDSNFCELSNLVRRALVREINPMVTLNELLGKDGTVPERQPLLQASTDLDFMTEWLDKSLSVQRKLSGETKIE